MLSGLSFLQMQLDQKVKNNTSWIGSLGLEDSQNIGRSVTCIVSMWLASMLLQLSSLMVTIKQSSAKDMTHQRQMEKSVTFSDDMKLTMKKDHFLSNSSNKQPFNNNYAEKVTAKGWLPNSSLTGKCWSPNSSDSCGKHKKGEDCSHGERQWPPYFIALLHRNQRLKINVFSLRQGQIQQNDVSGTWKF